MKKILASIILCLSVGPMVMAGQLQAYLSYSIFNTPDNQPYIETYLVVQGNTLTHIKLEDGQYQGGVDVQIIFKKNDTILNFGKYELLGPLLKDTIGISKNLLDVQRYSLPQGEYTLEFSLKDKYGTDEALKSDDMFVIEFKENQMEFSDAELLYSYEKSSETGPLEKNGYMMVPYVFDYYPETIRTINFYSELYNSKTTLADQPFILFYYIRPYEVDKKLDEFFFMKRMAAEEVNILLNTIDIANLPTGNYLLVLEARDRNNNLLAKKETFFQRYNPDVSFNMNSLLVVNANNTFAGRITSRDSLLLYIDYLYPISTEAEKTFAKSMLKGSTVEELQKYFLNFWTVRNEKDPEKEWEDYKFMVMQVNNTFTSLRIKGYRTDRGRVYLKYGPPNVRTPSYNEPAAYPYEIWQYYQLNNGQRDKKFVFSTRDLATNDFRLIHSNAVGELTNYYWEREVYSRTWDPYSIDQMVSPPSYGSFATDYYIQPR